MSDGPALQRFYSEVFGWQLDTNNPGGYGMYRQDGLTGGIGAAQDGSAGHVTFYVHCDDPTAVLAAVEAQGGRVLMPLTEVAPRDDHRPLRRPGGARRRPDVANMGC